MSFSDVATSIPRARSLSFYCRRAEFGSSRPVAPMATRLRSLLAPIAADLTGRRTRLCSRLFCTRSPRSGPPIPAWSNVLVLAQTSVPGPRPRCKPSIIRAIRCVEHVDRAVVENGDAEDARLAYRHLGLHTVLQWLRFDGFNGLLRQAFLIWLPAGRSHAAIGARRAARAGRRHRDRVGLAGILATYVPPLATSCATSVEGYRLSQYPS